MHLSDYMTENDLTDDQVADDIDVSRVTVSRIRRRKVRPDWPTIIKLKKWSRGAITADDFETVRGAA
jgi:DNA-binding XRE family transcriptional regulator